MEREREGERGGREGTMMIDRVKGEDEYMELKGNTVSHIYKIKKTCLNLSVFLSDCCQQSLF